MAIDTKYSKKSLSAIMERYTRELLQPHKFSNLPLKFQYELSQFRDSVSCHLRTTQGVVMQVDKLVEWFEKLPEEAAGRVPGSNSQAEDTGIPYQTLINLYLRECAASRKRLSVRWKSRSKQGAA